MTEHPPRPAVDAGWREYLAEVGKGLSDEERAAFLADRVLGDVTLHSELDDAIKTAAEVLGGRGHHDLAQRLRDLWRSYTDPALLDQPTVYRLPPEPEVGKTVRVRGGAWAGAVFKRAQDPPRMVCWEEQPPTGSWFTWWHILHLAGPDGVQVVEGGEGL